MSDPEPSVAISSSPSLPATDSNPLNYAFLVHSQKTLTQNLPPRVDNKLLARQKRRRTSPEDHAILESEYQQNPKPDKAARTSIVNRVSLGEKEIWFQNRRQNDRRKSKPLQPHELLAPRSGMVDSSGQPFSDDNASTEPGSSSGAEQFDINDHREEMAPKPWHGGLLHFSDDSDPVTEDKDEHELPQSTQTSVATEAAGETPPTTQEEFSQLVNDHSEDSLLQGRNALRIAMSSDGKAVIRGENEPSPSKNRVAMFSVRRTKMSSLRRSSSAVFPATPRAGVAEKDRAFGRSRDPRNWESFCDTDARTGRTALRVSSSLAASAHYLGVPQGDTVSLSTATQTHQSLSPWERKRRKLARTVSSLGRLETGRNKANMNPSKLSKPLFSKSGKPDLEQDPGDSDKENWAPGTRSTNIRRRNTSHIPRPVLRDANRNRGLGISTNGKRNRPLQTGSQGKAPPELSAEVTAFMAGGSGIVKKMTWTACRVSCR
ncbi:Homeodomain [Penicillium expansum]|nr:Homeodomain [Penicillium expansum]